MKKQQKTYGLLIAVVLIWGIIGYQIYSRLNPPILELNTVQINNSFTREKALEIPFYELKPEYRDPFLGKFKEKKKVVKTKKIIPKIEIPFPTVLYNGIIETSSSKSYILTINGKQQILKLGEVSQEIKLISADFEKAVIGFGKQRKTITKQ